MQELKKQLQSITFKGTVTNNVSNAAPASNNKYGNKLDSMASSENLGAGFSLDDEFGMGRLTSLSKPTSDPTEDNDQALERQLKRITRETILTKERKKAIELQLQDQNIIHRVKQLVTLPPDHVPEIGSFANPMRNHRESMIFTRVTGHPNIQDRDCWFDTNECWICHKHSKLSIQVASSDKMIEQEFQDIIVLTAMMTKRVWRRKEEMKIESEEPLEVMLEEKSQKSIESGTVSDSSGSGPDIMGSGHSAY